MAQTPSYSEKVKELSLHFLETRDQNISATSSQSLMSQIEHRLMLVGYWNIQKGSRILEIGCGQGDCTIVLADAVGEGGHVDAVDPGSPDYGAPFTLSQSQSHISKSPVGSRISFHNTSPITYLEGYSGPTYDYAVFCHCLYYFESPLVLPTILEALNPHTEMLCMAEWSLQASRLTCQPHILTALLLSTIEACRKIPANGNIRSVQSPKQLKRVAGVSGFQLQEEKFFECNEGLRDAYWEVSHTLVNRENVLKELRREESWEEKREVALIAMYDSIQGSVEALDGGVKGVTCMDVWVAKYI